MFLFTWADCGRRFELWRFEYDDGQLLHFHHELDEHGGLKLSDRDGFVPVRMFLAP